MRSFEDAITYSHARTKSSPVSVPRDSKPPNSGYSFRAYTAGGEVASRLYDLLPVCEESGRGGGHEGVDLVSFY